MQVCGSCNIDDVTCENCEFAKLLDGEVTWSEDRIYEKDEEYIRKDALLEWLKECKENPVITDLQKGNIQEIIEKIETL